MIQSMNRSLLAFLILASLSGCGSKKNTGFYQHWKFNLGELPGAQEPGFDDTGWEDVSIPHDWSIHESYTPENTASSTGFLPGGIGWYRKSFVLEEDPAGKHVRVEFDGIYNNSTVWINGVLLGNRPYGYSSFSYNLTDFLAPRGDNNVIAVRVDHSNYADSRWYTGSGIYRDVRLVVTNEVHIPPWGVRVTTPSISRKEATIRVETSLDQGSRSGGSVDLEIVIRDQEGREVAIDEKEVELTGGLTVVSETVVSAPLLWTLNDPRLYTATVSVKEGNGVLDVSENTFGIRSIRFDPGKGFFLNDASVKMKGVNMHHAAGCLGAAVPKDVWISRVKKLKSIGCNAIRLSHNPHDPKLLDACDELGMLVISEAFDEWGKPKTKHLTWLGSNDATPEVSTSYSAHFDQWGEQDMKDLVRRDFNHPSVIMWSIGNELEWTYPYYPQSSSYHIGNLDQEYFGSDPDFDKELILNRMKNFHSGPDTLLITAKKLSAWVREIDTTRFVTSGSVHPSVGFATGYLDLLDVVGFNYRAVEYDGAHKAYPNACIYGSENWATWPEWKAVNEREFVAGIFVWTGFSYMGEAGPWPRKGLTISLFDFAGFKTPRGHFFETLWTDESKVYMATTPESASEFSLTEESGWVYTERTYKIPAMSWLRRWEWYDVHEKWKYQPGERIVVQGYTNCEKAELFLNGESMGKKSLNDFSDRIMKWLVPYRDGELKLVGYTNDSEAGSYILKTSGEASRILIQADRTTMASNNRDVVMIEAQVVDEKGIPVRDKEMEVRFKVDGPAEIIGIDNGWEFNVQDAKSDRIETHLGKALAVVQAGDKSGSLTISVHHGKISSKEITINVQ